jgi:hypothetical protein
MFRTNGKITLIKKPKDYDPSNIIAIQTDINLSNLFLVQDVYKIQEVNEFDPPFITSKMIGVGTYSTVRQDILRCKHVSDSLKLYDDYPEKCSRDFEVNALEHFSRLFSVQKNPLVVTQIIPTVNVNIDKFEIDNDKNIIMTDGTGGDFIHMQNLENHDFYMKSNSNSNSKFQYVGEYLGKDNDKITVKENRLGDKLATTDNYCLYYLKSDSPQEIRSSYFISKWHGLNKLPNIRDAANKFLTASFWFADDTTKDCNTLDYRQYALQNNKLTKMEIDTDTINNLQSGANDKLILPKEYEDFEKHFLKSPPHLLEKDNPSKLNNIMEIVTISKKSLGGAPGTGFARFKAAASTFGKRLIPGILHKNKEEMNESVDWWELPIVSYLAPRKGREEGIEKNRKITKHQIYYNTTIQKFCKTRRHRS